MTWASRYTDLAAYRPAARVSGQATPYPAPRVDATAPSRDVDFRFCFIFRAPLGAAQ